MNTVKIDSNKAKIIAHRGLSGIERENTCPAFLAAANRSYYGIETDVHTTKDGKFVIIHDETLERVSLGKHTTNVEESDFSEVSDVILPDLDGTTVRRDIRIPLLCEYVKICQKYEKICVLEIKNHFEEDDIKRLVEEIKALGYIENVTFISFDFENCVNVKKLLPDNDVQFLLYRKGEFDIDTIIKDLLDNDLDLDIYYKLVTKELVDTLHKNNIKINCWTCDSKEDAENLIAMGVDYITSNILE